MPQTTHHAGLCRWDEWLDEDLLLPDNQTNRKRQSRMLKDHEVASAPETSGFGMRHLFSSAAGVVTDPELRCEQDSKVEREKRRQTVGSRSGGSKSKKAKLGLGESEGEVSGPPLFSRACDNSRERQAQLHASVLSNCACDTLVRVLLWFE